LKKSAPLAGHLYFNQIISKGGGKAHGENEPYFIHRREDEDTGAEQQRQLRAAADERFVLIKMHRLIHMEDVILS